ncbi:MAG: hypothetical protein WCQ67_01435 [Treponema sp.]
MNRDRHSHRHGNGSSNGSSWKNSTPSPRDIARQARLQKNAVSQEQIKSEDAAINAFKNTNQPICPKCGKPITDMASAIADRGSGTPIHFDCAIEALKKEEPLSEGDKITYIGQGRFGIVNFPNVHDTKHFTIKKIIDWEAKEAHSDWRNEISDLYSQIR